MYKENQPSRTQAWPFSKLSKDDPISYAFKHEHIYNIQYTMYTFKNFYNKILQFVII